MTQVCPEGVRPDQGLNWPGNGPVDDQGRLGWDLRGEGFREGNWVLRRGQGAKQGY